MTTTGSITALLSAASSSRPDEHQRVVAAASDKLEIATIRARRAQVHTVCASHPAAHREECECAHVSSAWCC